MIGLNMGLYQVYEEVSSSCFPKLEKLINKNEKLFDRIDGRKTRHYRGYVDYYLCFIFPSFKKLCFRYYYEKGPKLKDVLDEKTIKMMEVEMLASLKISLSN